MKWISNGIIFDIVFFKTYKLLVAKWKSSPDKTSHNIAIIDANLVRDIKCENEESHVI